MRSYKQGEWVVLSGVAAESPTYNLEGILIRKAIYPTEASVREGWWIVKTPGQDHTGWNNNKEGWVLPEAAFSHRDPEPTEDPEFDEARKKWAERL